MCDTPQWYVLVLFVSVNQKSTLIAFQELLGEEEYKKVLDKVNADLPEAQKVFQLTFHAQEIIAFPYFHFFEVSLL